MKYVCKLCNGRGKGGNSITCRVCRGKGFFDLAGKAAKQCESCKGSGRASIRALPCSSCGGKGFFVLTETKGIEISKADDMKTVKKEGLKMPEMATVPKASAAKKVARKKTVVEGEFGEGHLDDLKQKLTDILAPPR